MNPITEKLKSHSVRPTQVRKDVFEVLENAGFALSHADIEQQLQTHWDRVTIYRTLDLLFEKGLIHKIIDNSGTFKYALCISDKCTNTRHEHNHIHFKCIRCNKIFCLEPSSKIRPELPEGYQMQQWSLSADGLCQKCSQNI